MYVAWFVAYAKYVIVAGNWKKIGLDSRFIHSGDRMETLYKIIGALPVGRQFFPFDE